MDEKHRERNNHFSFMILILMKFQLHRLEY